MPGERLFDKQPRHDIQRLVPLGPFQRTID